MVSWGRPPRAILRLHQPLEPGERPGELLTRLMGARADAPVKSPHGTPLKKQRKPISATRVKKINAVLSSALNAAVQTHRIDTNPIEYLELPRIRGRRVKPTLWTAERVARWEETGKVPGKVMVWTSAQTGAFLDFITAERLYALFHLVAFRGLRRAEAAGLPWTDTDLDQNGTITIKETLPDEGEDYDDTKSEAGERVVALDTQTITVIQSWRRAQHREHMTAGKGWIDSGRVFTTPDGSALSPAAISRRFTTLIDRYGKIRHRHFNDGWQTPAITHRYHVPEQAVRVAIESGPLPPIRFHDLRHGAATLSLLAKVDMKVSSNTLGHTRYAFTADTYGLVLPELEHAAAEAAAAVVPLRQRATPEGHPRSR